MDKTIESCQEERPDALKVKIFHFTLKSFQSLASWPAWLTILGVVIVALGVGLFWGLLLQQVAAGIAVSLILGLFALIDATLLRSLPKRGISYGPWQSQLYALLIFRALASVILAIIGFLFGPILGMAVFVFIQILGSMALVWGAMIEPQKLRLTNLKIESDNLPSNSKPIRIMHISDLHVERLTRREDRVLELVEQASPDLILITGDYLNISYKYDSRAHSDLRQLLGQLSAPYGVYAVLGSPSVDDRQVVPGLFEGLPIDLLVNDWRIVAMDNGRKLTILGVDCSHCVPIDEEQLNELASKSPNNAPRVLLHHSPDLMPAAVKDGIDLYLCGHTHGGQVRLPLLGAVLTSAQIGRKYDKGHYHQGKTNLYVSCGVGLEGSGAPRVRFMAPPEITLVTIQGSSPKGA